MLVWESQVVGDHRTVWVTSGNDSALVFRKLRCHTFEQTIGVLKVVMIGNLPMSRVLSARALARTAALLLLRLVGWMLPHDHWVNSLYMGLFLGKDAGWSNLSFPFGFYTY